MMWGVATPELVNDQTSEVSPTGTMLETSEVFGNTLDWKGKGSGKIGTTLGASPSTNSPPFRVTI